MMKIKHENIFPDEKNPFKHCKLDRQKYSNILISIIDSYPNGFVLALNNKWGTGKTTFVKMFQQKLNNKNYTTLYFNAWENDFENNPLIALMGELKTISTKKSDPEFKNVLKKASTISKYIAPILAKAVAEKYLDMESFQDAIVGVTKGVTDIFERDVEEYAKKKESVKDFRTTLSEFISSINKDKPLIFIIDELDRCRPNYAVSILEQIKHFFSVPNIVFILSIDKEQLGHAIKGVYGSDDLDTVEYLRRFIDIEYSLPEQDVDVFYEYLYEYFEFDEFFRSSDRLKYIELKSDHSYFKKTCKLLFSDAQITLRQQEKIFAQSRLALRSFNSNTYVTPELFLLLTYIKIMHYSFYLDLKDKKLNIRRLQEEFLAIIQSKLNHDTKNQFIRLEFMLINAYKNSIKNTNFYTAFYKTDEETGERKLAISSIIKENAEQEIRHIIGDLHNRLQESELSLSYYTNKIDLLEHIK